MSHLSISRLSHSLLIVLALASFASAQDIRNPESAVGNRMRTDLRVDPVSHALQFQIPLGQYPGRAGASLPITLYYSSKLWNIKYMNTIQCQDDPGSLYRAEYAHTSASGWTSSLDGFSLPADISLELYDGYTTRPKNSSTLLHKIARMFITLPDGSRHELRKDDDFHPYNETITGLFYSVDGTRLIYDTTTGTLYLPDGSRYIITSSGQTFIDRNGNQLSYSSASRQWTDTLGRTISLPLGATAVGDGVGLSEQEYTYSIPGVGGTLLSYTLRWKHLSTAGVINEQETNQTLRYKGDHTTNCQTGTDYSGLFHSTEADYNGILKSNLFDPVVLYQIVLPTGQAYTFKYNIYGEITKVIYPTGGYERFSFGQAPLLSAEDAIGIYSQANRGVTGAWISPDGTTASEAHWTYSGFSTITPDGTRTDRSVFTNNQDWSAYGFEDPRLGMVYDERTYSSSGQMLRRKLTDYAVDGQAVQYAGYWAYKQRNPRPTKEVEILLDTGGNALTRTTTYQYDLDLNPTVTNHYDFASVDQTTAQTGAITSMPQGALMRTDESSFLVNDPTISPSTQAAYRARNLVALQSSSRIKNSAGSIVTQSSISYDEAAYPLFTYGSVTGWSDPGTSARGNPTTSGAWNNITGTYLQTHAQYDQSGSVRNSWDARGNLSQVEYSSSYAYAYPTLTRSAVPDPAGAYGSTTALITTSTYDFNTGLVTSTTDANGQTTTYAYNDSLARLTQVNLPDGGRTTHTYVDAHQCGPYVETRTLLDSAGRERVSYQFFDALGRLKRTFTYDNQDTNNPYLTVDTQYDSMGRAWHSSNPYRSSGCTAAVNPSGQWTATSFDALSRVLSVTTPDNAVVSTAYSGATVTVTDQAGKQRRSVTDGLGRLKEVYEDPNGVNYLTSYGYDALDNLTAVVQGVQTRTFVYDSLKRLTSATNPESGTISYQYDNNGNLTRKTDALGIYIDYTYDALNRNTTTNYSNTTIGSPDVPDITRSYDGAVKGKGRFWYSYAGGNYATGSTVEHTAVDSYDNLGRPLIQRQLFKTNNAWGPTYQTSRAYNLAGGVASQTYPSGHTISYNYDVAGRLGDKDAQNLAFTGNLGDGVGRSYAAGILYSPFGGMSKERFGTDTALYNKQFYNVRGQLAEIRVGTYSTDDGWWNRGAILNVYSALAGWTESREDNNGNLRKQMLYIPNDDQISGYVDSAFFYDYDSLNRLDVAREVVGGQNSWVQDYDYDRYGNRTINQTNTWGTGINKKQFTVSTANNRLSVPAGQSGEMIYNGAGNLTRDTYSGAAVTRAYDAENRMTSETQANNYVAGSYSYSADGQRVRRTVGGQPSAVTTWQIYGIDGELLAEYAANAAPASPQKEYGYRNGQLLITAEAAASDSGGSTQNVSWTNAVGVSTSGNSLTKTAATGWGNAGAASTQTIASGDGYVEATASETSTARLVGLSHTDADQNWASIDFGIDLNLDGVVYVFESGNNRGSFGTYATGDKLRVAIEGGVVKYKKNGTVFYTSTVGPSYPLLVDTSLYSNGGTLSNVVIGNGGSVNWLVADQLGTPRMVFDKTGSLAGTKRHDYLPFGEELYAGQGVRTLARGFGANDGVRQKFTDKERDSETGLDFFGARYYASAQGRFTGADPYDINFERQVTANPEEADSLLKNYIAQPQHWNRYLYALNNPLRYIDPDGLKALEYETELLGKMIKVKISDNLKSEDGKQKLKGDDLTKAQEKIKQNIDNAIAKLNSGQAKLSSEEITAINSMKGIEVRTDIPYPGMNGSTFQMTQRFSETEDPEALPAAFIHDSFHADQNRRHVPSRGTEAEKQASAFTFPILERLGMSNRIIEVYKKDAKEGHGPWGQKSRPPKTTP